MRGRQEGQSRIVLVVPRSQGGEQGAWVFWGSRWGTYTISCGCLTMVVSRFTMAPERLLCASNRFSAAVGKVLSVCVLLLS
jgi:hypothetical protein